MILIAIAGTIVLVASIVAGFREWRDRGDIDQILGSAVLVLAGGGLFVCALVAVYSLWTLA